MRPNQWRVARVLLEENPELLIKLELANGKIMVSGDKRYFPKLAGGTLEISKWLESTEEDTANYFTALLSLYASLVEGRNLRVSPTLQRLLPYDLVLAVVTNKHLNDHHLDVSRQFTRIACDLYVANDLYDVTKTPAPIYEEHVPMVMVKTIRKWVNVPDLAAKKMLNSRYNLEDPPDWARFNDLKEFAIKFLGSYSRQVGTKIKENKMVLELLKLVRSLLLMGFYKAAELDGVVTPLLKLLDGREDVTGLDGLHADKNPRARYLKKATIKCNTLLIMDVKRLCCETFQLICTVRLDIRLSLFLGMYHSAVGADGTAAPTQEALANSSYHFDDLFKILPLGAASKKIVPKIVSKSKVVPMPKGGAGDLVSILLDLTHYEDASLVSAALGLLVRQYEQRKVLERQARRVQILVVDLMIRMYARFDDLLSQLSRLSERRRLFGNEIYQAVYLMSMMTMHCYEEGEDDGDDEKKSVGRGSKARSSTKTSKSGLRSDHTAGLYLMLVGRAEAKMGSQTLRVTHAEDQVHSILKGSSLHILNGHYKVASYEGDQITLETAISVANPTAFAPKEMQDGGTSEVFIFLECRAESVEPNPDLQLLLYNMGAHDIVLRFLNLPVAVLPVPDDFGKRQVLIAAYRMLKALCSGFKVTQLALVPHIDKITSQIELQLISHDITPTGCLISILKDNPSACMQISDDLIRRFIRMAAESHAPRFIRFLRNITGPEEQPILRTQFFVIQGISENIDAQVFFDGEEGIKERDELIAKNDHINNPRGKLAYHIELIGLVARCTEGIAPGPEMVGRSLITLTDIMRHLNCSNLPLTLRANYLAFFDEAYLFAKRPLEKSNELIVLLNMFANRVENYVRDTLPSLDRDFDRFSPEGQLTEYVFGSLTTTARLYFEKQYVPDENAGDLVRAVNRLGSAFASLEAAVNDDDCLVKEDLDLGKLETCMRALRQQGVLTAEQNGVLEELHDATTGEEGQLTTGNVVGLSSLSALDSLESKEAGTRLAMGPPSDDVERLSGGEPEQATPPQKWHPQALLGSFVDIYHTQAGAGDSEFLGLVEVFMPEPSAAPIAVKERQEAAASADDEEDAVLPVLNEAGPLQNLVSRLQDGIKAAGGDGTIDFYLTSACARILRSILEDAEAIDGDELTKRQGVLQTCGVPQVVLRLVSCENVELYKSGLDLGVQLARGGHKGTQEALYDLLSNHTGDDTAGLDGSGSTFFGRVRDALRLAVKEIPEQRSYNQMQTKARDNFDDLTFGLAGATVALLRANMEAPFETRSHPGVLLEFLQVICEGHFEPMQNLYNNQPYTLTDVDVTSEVCQFLLAVEANLTADNISLAQQACDTLTEVLQGNTSGKNARSLLDSKLVEMCNRVLTKPPPPPDEGEEPISEAAVVLLQSKVLTLLHALLEEHFADAIARMEAVIDLPRLAALASAWQDHALDPKKGAPIDSSTAELMVEAGFLAYSFLRKVTDNFEDKAAHTYEAMSDESRAHYEKYLGRVEICDNAGNLQRVYFRIPAHVLLLSPKTKDDLLWGVDRETPGLAVQEFMLAAPDLHVEVVWQDILARSQIFQAIVKREQYIEYASLCLAVVQNIVLIIRSALLTRDFANYVDSSAVANAVIKTRGRMLQAEESATTEEQLASMYQVFTVLTSLRLVLGSIQILTCGIQLVTHFMRVTFLGVLKITTSDADRCNLRQTLSRLNPLTDPNFFARFHVMMMYVVATDRVLVFQKLVFFSCAIIGLTGPAEEEIYVVHLFQLVFGSKDLLDVLRAVTQNLKQLMLTVLLLLLVMWAFAVWTVNSVVKDNMLTETAHEACQSLGTCWLEIINSMISGGVVAIVEPPSKALGNPGDFFTLFLFHVSFFVVVITVLMNVVFGIIIDTFAELRGEKMAKKAHMDNFCFICGIDRFTYDTKGQGFEQHLKEDHWMWTYMAMMVHIFEKETTELNGWESMVASKVMDNDASFLPRNTALVLERSQEEDATALGNVDTRLETLEKQNDKMMKLLEAIVKDNASRQEAGGGEKTSSKRLLKRQQTSAMS